MSKTEENIEKSLSDSRIYEVGYLLVPSIPEENVSVLYGDIKESVHALGGNVITDEMPKMIPLAYQMEKVIANVNNKFNNAYFGWVKFEIDPENISVLKQKFELDSNIIRFLITKTVRENTIATKRFAPRDTMRRRVSERKETVEVATEINKEEIDKEIEALVVE